MKVCTHNFHKSEIKNWPLFMSIVKTYDFRVRYLGGNKHTHQINCRECDFKAMIEISTEKQTNH